MAALRPDLRYDAVVFDLVADFGEEPDAGASQVALRLGVVQVGATVAQDRPCDLA